MKILKNLSNYGPWEWVALIVGILFIYRPVHQYMTGQFDHIEGWQQLGVLVLPAIVLALGLVLVGKPMSVLDFIRKRAGMETRKKKIQDEEFEEETGIDPDKPLI